MRGIECSRLPGIRRQQRDRPVLQPARPTACPSRTCARAQRIAPCTVLASDARGRAYTEHSGHKMQRARCPQAPRTRARGPSAQNAQAHRHPSEPTRISTYAPLRAGAGVAPVQPPLARPESEVHVRRAHADLPQPGHAVGSRCGALRAAAPLTAHRPGGPQRAQPHEPLHSTLRLCRTLALAWRKGVGADEADRAVGVLPRVGDVVREARLAQEPARHVVALGVSPQHADAHGALRVVMVAVQAVRCSWGLQPRPTVV